MCLDVVHLPLHPEGNAPEHFGGILFSVATAANLLSERDAVVPVFGVGEAEYDRVIRRLSVYPNVRTDGIFKFKGQTNRVHLIYQEQKETRLECSRDIADPIPFERIKPFLGTDGILINMISGFDITLDTLDRIRMEMRDRGTPIHFDFHSLTLGIDKEHTRFRRPLLNWRRWCFMLNSIQMSEEEARGLTSERYSEEELINQLMPLMVRALLLTRGERGITLIRQEHKRLSRIDLEGISLPGSVDPTGCGDVFGTSFLIQYLRTKDALQAATFANQIAAFNTTFPGAEGLDALKDFQFTGTNVRAPQ